MLTERKNLSRKNKIQTESKIKENKYQNKKQRSSRPPSLSKKSSSNTLKNLTQKIFNILKNITYNLIQNNKTKLMIKNNRILRSNCQEKTFFPCKVACYRNPTLLRLNAGISIIRFPGK